MNLNLAGIHIGVQKPLLNMGGQIEFDLQGGAIKGFDLQATLIKLDNTLNFLTGKQQTKKKVREIKKTITEKLLKLLGG